MGPPPASANRAKIAAAPIATCANAKSAKAGRIEALGSAAKSTLPHRAFDGTIPLYGA
jgi:hypothetical protein